MPQVLNGDSNIHINVIPTGADAIKKLSGNFNELEKNLEQVNRLIKEMGKMGSVTGVMGTNLTKNSQEVKEYAKAMHRVGNVVNKNAKSIKQMAINQKMLNAAMKQTGVVGRASTASIKVMGQGGGAAFKELSGNVDRFRVKLTVLKNDLIQVSKILRSRFQNAQWLGRQMMVGLSVPLALFGQQAISAFRDLEQQQVRLKKVFFDVGDSIEHQSRVFDTQLAPAIDNISRKFGQTRQITTALMADWAQFGTASTRELRKLTDITSEFALLGDIDLDVATPYVRSVFATFGENDVGKTVEALQKLNAIENATALSTADLAESLPEIASVAMSLNIPIENLAGSLAAMANVGIPVNEAVHGLKFGLQRLASPTAKAQEIMDAFGISLFNADGSSKNITNVLIDLAEKLKGADDQTRSYAMTQIFGARQASRMGSMLDDLAKGADGARSAFQDATRAAGGDVAGVAAREMEAIRSSTGFQLTQLHNRFKMFMEDLGGNLAQPLIFFMKQLQKLMDMFGNLSPAMQRVLVGILAITAALGPAIYVVSQFGLAITTVVGGLSHLIPGFKILSEEVALAELGNKAFTGQIIKVGDAYMLAKGKLGNYMADLLHLNVINKDSLNALQEELVLQKMLATMQDKTGKFHSPFTGGFLKAGTEEEVAKTYLSQLAAMEAATKTSGNKMQSRWKEMGKSIVRVFTAPFRGVGKVIFFPLIAGYNKFFKGWVDNVTADVDGLKNKFFALGRAMKAATTGKLTSLRDAFKNPGAMLGNVTTQAKGLMGILADGTVAITGAIASFGTTLAAVLVGLYIFVPLIVAAGAAFIAIKRNWQAMSATVKPGLDALKAGFGSLMDSLERIGTVIMDQIAGTIGGPEVARAGSTWERIGAGIGMVLESIGTGLEKVGHWLEQQGQIWNRTSGIAIYAIEAIRSAIEGDWGEAFHNMAGAFVYGFIVPAAEAVDFLIQLLIDGLEGAMVRMGEALRQMAEESGQEGFFDNWDSWDGWGLGQVAEATTGTFQRWGADAGADTAEAFGRGLGGVEGGSGLSSMLRNWAQTNWPVQSGMGAKMNGDFLKAGREAGGAAAEGAGDAMNEEMGNLGEEAADEWLSEWLGAVQNALQGIMDELKQQAMKALEDKFAKDLAVYDKQIEAIEKIEKAEAKRFAREEYLQRRHEMLRTRALQFENYSRDRALAIYEGRIDDARMLDLEEQRNQGEHTRNLRNLDRDRRRDLIQQARDEEKEKIKIAQDAAKRRQDILRESFERQLDIIMRYAPRTVGEFNNMLGSISGALRNAGVHVWPGHARTGMALYAQAIQRANNDLRQQAAWSGNNAATAWLAAFVAGDVRAGLQAASATQPPDIAGLRNGGGGGGGGGSGSGFTRNTNPNRGTRNGGRGSPSDQFHTGGKVPGQAARDVPATLQSGEFVVQRKAARAVGGDFLEKINQAHAVTPKFHQGGQVGPDTPGGQMRGGMKDFVKDLSAAWMYNQVAIGGLTSGAVAYLFESLGATVGGKTLADVMPSGSWANIDDFAKWITSLPQFSGISYGGTPATGGQARPQNPSSDHPRGFAADFFHGGGTTFNPKLEALFQFLGAGGKAGTLPTKYAIYFDRDISANTGWSAQGPTSSYDRHLDHVHLSVLDSIAQFGDAAGGYSGTMPTGALQTMVRNMMLAAGWGADQWGPLYDLIMKESTWNPNAQNRSSTAYGLFQFLDSTWGGTGIAKTSNPQLQTTAGLRYIRSRYGSPAAALAFHNSHGWYHGGGPVGPGGGLMPMMAGGKIPHDNYPASLHKGEIVLPQPIAKNITAMADKHDTIGGTTINVYADTFMGDFEWFKKQAARYDIEVVPRKKAASGTTVRRVRSRAGV